MGRSASTSGSPVRRRRQKLLLSGVAIVLVLPMRDERGTRRKQRAVLDTVMIVSVLLAIVVGGIEFLAFAGSPLPG